MFVKAMREKKEHQRVVKMTTLSLKAVHVKWDVSQKKTKQKKKQSDLIGISEVKYIIKSVYDLFPTPANKNNWLDTNKTRIFCGENSTIT